MNRWKFRIGVVCVFLLGLVIGGAGTCWWFTHSFHDFRGPRGKVEARIMKHISGYLDLTDDQKAKIAPIVHDAAVQLDAIRTKTEPEIRKVMEEGLAKAKPILTDAQYAKVEKRYKEMREKWQHRND